MITIVAVGKKHEDWVTTGIDRYQQRLRQPFDIRWELLPHSIHSADLARREESERVLKRIGDDAYVILLDETGKRLSSPALSELLERTVTNGRHIIIVIGGAYGVDASVHERADTVLSLSDMVFPHQLVRLILVEQLYRAQSIATGGKYHHE